MHAELEPLLFVIRIFEDNQKYGDPYRWSATAIRIDPQTLEILGVLRAPIPSEWRAINDSVFRLGYKTVLYRRADGRIRNIKLRNRIEQ